MVKLCLNSTYKSYYCNPIVHEMYDFGETALPICSGHSHPTNVVACPPFLGLSLEVHNAGVSPFRLKINKSDSPSPVRQPWDIMVVLLGTSIYQSSCSRPLL